MVLLGFGVVFGTWPLPREVIAPIIRAWSPALDGGDPLAALQGRADHRPIDLAVLNATASGRARPIRGRPCGPRPSDIVMAIGFPTIDTSTGHEEAARTTIEEA